ncbi:hypothetical protein VTK56DRAFT_7925 [Thermocarpiscus australiensis]
MPSSATTMPNKENSVRRAGTRRLAIRTIPQVQCSIYNRVRNFLSSRSAPSSKMQTQEQVPRKKTSNSVLPTRGKALVDDRGAKVEKSLPPGIEPGSRAKSDDKLTY